MADFFIAFFLISFVALIAFFFLIIFPLKNFTRHKASLGLIGAFGACCLALVLYASTAQPAKETNQDSISSSSLQASASASSISEKNSTEGGGSFGWFLTVIIFSIGSYYFGCQRGKNAKTPDGLNISDHIHSPDQRLSPDDGDELFYKDLQSLKDELKFLRTEMASRDTRWQDGQSGKFAQFTYVNANGVVTERKIVNWTSEGAYIVGFCSKKKDSWPFRKDKIENWVSN